MRWLIVNADDFGLSPGVNAGIRDAHTAGIVTSTSVLVTGAASDGAAAVASELPSLGLGLHVDLDAVVAGAVDEHAAEHALERQIAAFVELTGQLPTHLDSHHNVHRLPALGPIFEREARRLGVPLRDGSVVRHHSAFYGRWGGAMHPEQISVASLLRMLADDIRDGVTELACHPGNAEPDLPSSYRQERAIEVATLCDPAVRDAIDRFGIRLVTFRDVAVRGEAEVQERS